MCHSAIMPSLVVTGQKIKEKRRVNLLVNGHNLGTDHYFFLSVGLLFRKKIVHKL